MARKNQKINKVRVFVHKSNKRTYLQAVDPQGQVVGSFMTGGEIKDTIEGAQSIGEALAKTLVAKKIATAVFVKGKCKFHGKVKAAVEGMRKGGIKI